VRRKVSRAAAATGVSTLLAVGIGVLTNVATQSWNWPLVLALGLLGTLWVIFEVQRSDRENAAPLRDRTATTEAGPTSAVPWMAPPLDRIVERAEFKDLLLASLIRPGQGQIGLTAALHGAGGLGKTTLAAWAAHQPEVRDRYPGGLLWATIGQGVRGADLAERINDMSFILSGKRPAIIDPGTAGAELGRLLDERTDPILLVIDDVWETAQLRAFRFGGRTCSRLVTTRIAGLLPPDWLSIPVRTMSVEQSELMLSNGVPDLSPESAELLAQAAWCWPVLLQLVNGALRKRTLRGEPAAQAAQAIAQTLVADGPAAFDLTLSTDRSQAVAATVGASLTLLTEDDQDRCLDLGIFPEDVSIPADLLGLLWERTPSRVNSLCEELVELGLAIDYRSGPAGFALHLHDSIRAFFRSRRRDEQGRSVQRRLLDAARSLLDSDDGGWPSLPPHADYLWRHLPWHLHESGDTRALSSLVTDLKWIEAKTLHFDSVVPAMADLELTGAREAGLLREVLARDAGLLTPMDPPPALGATLASRVTGVPGLEEVLRQYETGMPAPRLRPAWPLPDVGGTDEVVGHVGSVWSCVFAPDGESVVTVSDDGTARSWRTSDGSQHQILRGHRGGVWACAFSSDGQLLATTSDDHRARLWRMPDGIELATLNGHTDWVRGCEFSPDGTLLATASHDGTLRLWQVADPGAHIVLTGHDGPVTGCAFSADGKLLASTGFDATIRLWHLPDGELAGVLRGHATQVNDCTFAYDGSMLASVSSDLTVRFWDLGSRTELAAFEHPMIPYGCDFSPTENLLATTSADGRIRMWNADARDEPVYLDGHIGRVWDCAFSSDGTLLASAGYDRTTRLWNVRDARELTVLPGADPVNDSCAFSPDGTIVATTANGSVRLQTTESGATELIRRMEYSGWAWRCDYAPDGTLLGTAAWDRTARLWRIADGEVVAVLGGHDQAASDCVFSPDGSLLASSSHDGTVRLWHVATATLAQVLKGHAGSVLKSAFSPDGSLLATAGDDWTVRLWRASDGEQLTVLSGHTDVVNECTFSPDGRLLASASDDRTVRLWSVPDGASVATLRGHGSWVESCTFSKDGTLLATGGRDQVIRLWRTTDFQTHCAIRIGAPVTAMAWHPTRKLLCAVGGLGVYLFDYLPPEP
jgi:WD40 repeat protein